MRLSVSDHLLDGLPLSLSSSSTRAACTASRSSPRATSCRTRSSRTTMATSSAPSRVRHSSACAARPRAAGTSSDTQLTESPLRLTDRVRVLTPGTATVCRTAAVACTRCTVTERPRIIVHIQSKSRIHSLYTYYNTHCRTDGHARLGRVRAWGFELLRCSSSRSRGSLIRRSFAHGLASLPLLRHPIVHDEATRHRHIVARIVLGF